VERAWRIVGIIAASVLVSAILLLSCRRQTPPPSPPDDLRLASCLGPTDAKHFAVYLHGVDERTISDQEHDNRRSLEVIAKALSLRIALPRASTPCPHQPSELCWGWAFDASELDAASQAVSSAAASCFGTGRPFGLIGFSNGGYLLTKLLRTCSLRQRLPGATWMMTIGSAMSHESLKAPPDDLSGCGRLVMLAGTHDQYNFDPGEALLHALEAQHADVRAVRFDGGHTVPLEPTRAALADLLGVP